MTHSVAHPVDLEPASHKRTDIPADRQLRSKLGLGSKSPSRAIPAKVVGHRGALYDHLENTREAFQQCVQYGCDAVELDVFTIRDEQSDEPVVIVFHGGGTDQNPGDLSDYCIDQNGVCIEDISFSQSQLLQFNPTFAEFQCPETSIRNGRIPKLKEVLEDLKGTGTQLKIELKGENTVEPTLRVVEELGMTDQCSYSSFDHEKLKRLRGLRPDHQAYPTGALFEEEVPHNFVEVAQACGASEIHLRYDTCTVGRIQEIREASMRSMAWFRGPVGMASDVQERFFDIGNEDESCYQALIDTGVDELCVNRPGLLKRMVEAE